MDVVGILLGLPGLSLTPVEGGGGGEVPAWVEAWRSDSGELPTDLLDFKNDWYWSNGSVQSVSALLGGAFDPAAITVDGMVVETANANRPIAIGDLATSMIQSTGTFVFWTEFTGVPTPSDPSNGEIFDLDSGDGNATPGALQVDWYGAAGAVDDTIQMFATNTSNGSYDILAEGPGNADWYVACSMKASGDVTSSINGAAVHTDVASGPDWAPGLVAQFGFRAGRSPPNDTPLEGVFEIIARYDLLPDSDLPGLSAIPA